MSTVTGRHLAAALASLLGVALTNAQSVSWVGPTLSGDATAQFNASTFNTAANWSTNAVPGTTNDVFFTGGNMNSTNTDTFHMGGNRVFSSINFDNTGGVLPWALRISASNQTGSQIRWLTLSAGGSAGGNIITVNNGANVTLFAYPTNPITGNTGSTLHVGLNYSGTANVHVDGSSSLSLTRFSSNTTFTANGTVAKTGAGNLTITGRGNNTGDFVLVAGNVIVSQSTNNTAGVVTAGAFGVGTLTLSGGAIMSNDTNAKVIDNNVQLGGNVTLGNSVNSGALTLASGSMTLTANSVINNPSVVTISQNISGSYSLTKTGAGTLNLDSTNNTYTGGTILQGGMLQMGGTNKLPTNGDVTFDGGTIRAGNAGFTANGHNTTITANGGTFSIANTYEVIWGGNISGEGSLTRTGGSGAKLTLTGTNTYSGGTIISAGTVQVGNGSTTGSITGNISNSGTLAFNRSDAVTYAGAISGSGAVTNIGSGTLNLTGDSSAFAGTTTISSGGLKLNGQLGGTVSLAAGTSLSGTGTFSGAVSISGAHNPGNSPGVQTFGGNLTYNENATVNWELSSNTITQGAGTLGDPYTFDQIVVGGTLNFAGATTLNLAFNGSGSTVDWTDDTFWGSNRTWLVYDSNTTSNYASLTLSAMNWVDGFGNEFNTERAGSSFSLSLVGQDIFLNYTAAAIPEPSTYAALAGLGALGLVMWKRRRRAQVTTAKSA